MSEDKRNSKLVPLTIMIEELQLSNLRNIAKMEERSLSAQIRYFLELNLTRTNNNLMLQEKGHEN